MARIDEYLQKILSARYGEEVRGAIHDSIDEINRVNEANISTVQTIADTAQGYADDAEDSKDLAAQAVTNAQAQVALAEQQVTLATTQATNSTNSAEDSEAWAVGQRGGIDVPSSDETYQNNSKYWQERANYWYQQAQAIAESFSGALRPMGTVTFENLPPLAQTDSGDMYNISNQFTTTSDFVEGAGIVVPLGSNVYKTTGGKWDVLAGSPVTGVKGNSESSYRRGNVNITKSNIGLGNVDNTSDANKPISTAQQTALDLKQNITDNSLTTTNKTIPGAINEIKDSLSNKADKTQLPQRISDTFSPTIISGNISDAIASVYVFGYVETIYITFTLSASVPPGTELISIQNMASNPGGFVPVNFVRFNDYRAYEGYVNGIVNKIVALETLPADRYAFSYTYIV